MAGAGGDDMALSDADRGGLMGEALGDWYGVVGLVAYGVTLLVILFLLWVMRGR